MVYIVKYRKIYKITQQFKLYIFWKKILSIKHHLNDIKLNFHIYKHKSNSKTNGLVS